MITCHWCGSRKHESEHCAIRMKANLLIEGVPAKELFDVILEVKKKILMTRRTDDYEY